MIFIDTKETGLIVRNQKIKFVPRSYQTTVDIRLIDEQTKEITNITNQTLTRVKYWAEITADFDGVIAEHYYKIQILTSGLVSDIIHFEGLAYAFDFNSKGYVAGENFIYDFTTFTQRSTTNDFIVYE